MFQFIMKHLSNEIYIYYQFFASRLFSFRCDVSMNERGETTHSDSSTTYTNLSCCQMFLCPYIEKSMVHNMKKYSTIFQQVNNSVGNNELHSADEKY